MSYAYDQAVAATNGLEQGKSSIDDINSWWKDTHTLFRNNPEEFQQWSQENPEMAIRWHARAANENVNTGWDSKKHDQMAKVIALGHGQALGMGDDMKENGRMLATDYKSFKDVNNEWGEGDFWKIGTPQTLDKGFGAFVDNLDLKDIAMMAAPFIVGPLLGPALAGMNLSPAMTGALTKSLMTGLKGGDLKDILVSGATPFVNAGLGSMLDGALYGTELGDTLLQKGWDLNAISQGFQKGGMEFLKGNDLQDIVLGGLESYIDAGGGLGNLPGPGLDFEMPDWLPEGDGDLFAGAKDLFGDIGDWTEEKWDQFKDVLPNLPNMGGINLPGMPDINLPGMPDWKGPDWNPNMPDMPGMPQGGNFGQIAQGMLAPREPAELAKLNAMPTLGPVQEMGPWIYNPQGMMG